MDRSWLLLAVATGAFGAAVACGGTLAPSADVAADGAAPATTPSADAAASRADSSPSFPPPTEADGGLDATIADDVAAGNDVGADVDQPDGLPESDGPSIGPSSAQCPITMSYVDEAWAEIQTGQWPACPDGGGCAAGDCCLMYTGWSPPTPKNTTACVAVIDAQ